MVMNVKHVVFVPQAGQEWLLVIMPLYTQTYTYTNPQPFPIMYEMYTYPYASDLEAG